MVGTIVITWALGRIFGGLHDPLALMRVIVIRVCFGLILAIVTAQAVLAGGFWLLLAAVCGLLALFRRSYIRWGSARPLAGPDSEMPLYSCETPTRARTAAATFSS